ncbi:MAG: DNA topoisomerase 4 subunit A [Deltaproteobacteria bacterium]|nr:DNA topoisomerase 4 subunit A [Deltaproteobacteria bacterium]MCB9786969.1 DNA topoisomerase 4 subunit A [Deltaproteobacteria bacterium]
MSDKGSGSGRSARRVQHIGFATELGAAFGRYAEKVILDRAIPDIRDGLKPVQRRIVYAMFEAGNTADKPYRKSAKTVGDVMGNYHPHGDSAIYEALVRLAQPWKMRYPLIDGHGNFGSMDDDPPAAMRYTEARLSPIAEEFMRDLGKDTVAWKPNFDEKTEEPVVLPSGFLNLLVNGTSGVSAGFATEVPSHNLGEVMNAALALLADPTLGTRDLMRYVAGPDFPTGGILMGASGLEDAYETGRGKVVLRARHTVERQRDGKDLLVFTEIPYNVIKSELVRQLDGLRLDKEVQGVLDVRDETDREGLRIVVELSRQADTDGVLAYLLKKTDLQINYHFNMVAIARNTPRQVGLVPILRAFVEHRREVVRRRSRYDLDRAEVRLHEVEGLIRAVDMLDEIIATIRASKDRADARENICDLGFTVEQAEAILELRLARLTGLQILQLTEERDQLLGSIARLEAILGDPAVCDKVVADELASLRDRYADARRTTIQDEVERLEVALEVVVKPQDVVVGVTDQGYIKRASLASFQASGGDRKKSGVRPGDRMHEVVLTNTTHTVMVMSASGQCFPLPVHQIPEQKWADVGTALVNVCGIDKDDPVVSVISCSEFPEDRYFLMVTESGAVKATPMSEFASSRQAGLVALKLQDGDRLSRVMETDGAGELLLMTTLGRGIRFGVDEVSVQGRSARGVAGMKTEAGDAVRDVVLVPEPRDDLLCAVFTESGKAKLTPLSDFPKQRRGGKGVRVIVARAKAPHRCAAIHVCSPEDSFEVVDTQGLEHPVDAVRIPITRRDGNAWTMVNLKDGALVALVEHRPDLPVPEEAAGGAPAAGDEDGEE